MEDEILIEYKNRLLQTFVAFDEFCTTYGLNYFACSGTAIGAVRHKGFIPWDDDIDVLMLRKDYDRLIQLRSHLNETHYRIADLGDEGYIYPFAKFYDTNTTLQEYKAFPTCCLGVYVDIFPLDEVPDNIDKVRKAKVQYEQLFRDFQNTFFKPSLRWGLSSIYHLTFKTMFRTLYCCNAAKKRKEVLREQFVKFENNWIKDKGPNLLVHHAIYSLEREIFPMEWFDSYIYMPFENYQIRVCSDYDKYLTHLFGDYMTLPPVEDQVSHHSHYYLNLKEGLTTDEVKRRVSKGEHLVY